MNKICGIYCIENLENGNSYVGASTDVRSRMYQHFSDLRHNRHRGVKLQTDYNRYGRGSFIFRVLEDDIPIDKLAELEQFWIKQMGEYNSKLITYGVTHQVIEKLKEKNRNRNAGRRMTEVAKASIGYLNSTTIKEYWDSPAGVARKLARTEAAARRREAKQCIQYIKEKKEN